MSFQRIFQALFQTKRRRSNNLNQAESFIIDNKRATTKNDEALTASLYIDTVHKLLVYKYQFIFELQ